MPEEEGAIRAFPCDSLTTRKSRFAKGRPRGTRSPCRNGVPSGLAVTRAQPKSVTSCWRFIIPKCGYWTKGGSPFGAETVYRRNSGPLRSSGATYTKRFSVAISLYQVFPRRARDRWHPNLGRRSHRNRGHPPFRVPLDYVLQKFLRGTDTIDDCDLLVPKPD